ncbi:hypothetical protein CFIICLFH_2445 [Methylobacterium goesingense]|uniref:Uncharacterized protein n=1 Tax=Methylobacterium goesingense TaxID=243690 RepID=A0ABV2LA07_9HYPH|nr:hypothetical protein CFIICLFH_2445 [Methylobacterium goesingense]
MTAPQLLSLTGDETTIRRIFELRLSLADVPPSDLGLPRHRHRR